MTGTQLDAHTEAARIGTIANEAELELFVGVTTFIAQHLQTLPGDADEQVCITVIVEIRGDNRIDLAFDQLIEAELSRDLAESRRAQIAPDAKAIASGNDIKPAIIVVVHKCKVIDSEVAEGKRKSVCQPIENAFDLSFGRKD